MIQRVQTLMLLAAFLLAMACLMGSLGTFVNEGLTEARMFNLWIAKADGSRDLRVAPLFCLLILAATMQLIAVFMYKHRPTQARICLLATVPLVLWYLLWAAYAFAGIAGVGANDVYHPTWGRCVLPLFSTVFTLWARRCILADERLVRAADRIR